MNWKQINEKYPKSLWEWLRYEDIITSESKTIAFTLADANDFHELFETDIGYHFWLDQERIYQMPHYFDTLGIIINLELYDATAVNKWAVNLFVDLKWIGYLLDSMQQQRTFPDRLSALKAGVEKAFEIREEQLSQ